MQRPRGWVSQVKNYIASVPKNSFYLLEVFSVLRSQYQFSFASEHTLKEIAHPIEVAMTKHVTGVKDPGIKLVQKTIPTVKLADEKPIVPVRTFPVERL